MQHKQNTKTIKQMSQSILRSIDLPHFILFMLSISCILELAWRCRFAGRPSVQAPPSWEPGEL